MISIPEEKIMLKKGRLGPGEIIAVELKKGKLFLDQEIKKIMYQKVIKNLTKQIVDLEKKN